MSRWDALQPSQNNSKEKKQNPRTTRNRSRRFDDSNTIGQSRIPSFQNKQVNAQSFVRISDRTRHKDLAKQWNEIIERVHLLTTNQYSVDDNAGFAKINSINDGRTNDISKNLSELWNIMQQLRGPGSQVSLSARSKGRSVATLVEFCISNPCGTSKEKAEMLDIVLALIQDSRDTPIEMSAEESKQCIRQLILEDIDMSQLKMKDTSQTRLECVVGLLPSVAKHLPAEETANNLVRNKLIPLAFDPCRNQNQNCVLAMQGLQNLLEDESRKHASAILAPLVVDVMETGEEKLIMNPLHRKIVQGLTGKLIYDDVEVLEVDSDSILNHACTTLTCVLNCIRSIESHDTSRRTSVESHSINVHEMETFFHKILQLPRMGEKAKSTSSIQANVLQLLLALLQTYPDSSSVLGRLLVSQKLNAPDLVISKNASISNSNTCQCCLSTPLMTLLHTKSQLSLPALLCTHELLKSMPLHLWLTGRTHPIQVQDEGLPSKQRALGNGPLNRSMSSSVEQLLKVIRCRLQSERRHSDLLVGLCNIMTFAMFSIPFCNDKLLDEGVKLISAAGIIFGRASNPEVFDILGESLSECMGGRLTPQGLRTKMPVPVKKWLSSKAISRSFINILFACTPETKQAHCLKILASMVRTEPGLALSQSGWWENFHEFFMTNKAQTSSTRTNLDEFTLLENLLLGRKEFGTKDVTNMRTDDVIVILESFLPGALLSISTPTSLRPVSLNIYGALVGEDWAAIFSRSEAEGVRHIDAVLSYCTNKNEASASVRSVACKALGNICTECLTMKSGYIESEFSRTLSLDSAESICNNIGDVLTTALRDSAPSVRSMAMFAVGNLAQTLYRLDDEILLLDGALLIELTKLTFDCLNDDNDKVVGNAIRTSGHISLLVFQHYNLQQQDTSSTKEEWDGRKFYLELMNVLSFKVTTAVTETTGKGGNQHTWKQRSIIRKHGWGSCASLGLLLHCRIVVEQQEMLLQAVKDAILSLVLCLHHVDTVNDKVVLAAASALSSIPSPIWTCISSGSSGIVGSALTSCISGLFAASSPQQQQEQQKKKNKLQRLHEELYKLLKQLLKIVTIYDVCCVLKEDTITKSMLEYLYDWMIMESQQHSSFSSNDDHLDASAFEVFALALQRKDIADALEDRENNIDLQQKFASRALERYRREQESHHIVIATTPSTTTNEEASIAAIRLEDNDKSDDEEEYDEL